MSTATRFTVAGLFGEYDHEISFPETDEFAIIYGRNGVGKTRLFEIIRSLSDLNLKVLGQLPFRSASIEYSDHSLFAVTKSKEGDLTLSLATKGKRDSWTCDADRLLESRNVAGAEWYEEQPGIWVDRSDGETLDEDEFFSRYNLAGKEDVPDFFKEFADRHSTYLIETQRLGNRPADTRRGFASAAARRRRSARDNEAMTVSRYAADVSDRLRAALTENSRTTAALDRTFPQRLLQEQAPDDVNEQSIRERYSKQNAQRQRLARLSLIGSEPDFDLPERHLEASERTVLWLYLDDTEKKLATFSDVVQRAELLEEIVNRRFLRKKISVNAEEGLVIRTSHGQRILPQDLSSGEQHELIMFYDMLFRVSPGSLVLIDEPEISLHVAWQRRFLDDMMRVSRLSSARILIATHSPQIIGKWRSRTTSLGPSMEEDADMNEDI